MSLHEFTAIRTRLEIHFWDLLINIMTTLSKIRQGLNKKYHHKIPVRGAARTALNYLIWLFAGLYIGFLFGYLGI
jgi:hypothetical protein